MNYKNLIKRHLRIKFLSAAFLTLFLNAGFAIEVPIYDFPITAYSQNSNDYLSSNQENYNRALLNPDYQKLQLKQFYNHYYASDAHGLSPWSEQMVVSALPLMKKIVPEILEEFNNQNKSNDEKHFAENFKEHNQRWWNKIKENLNLYALESTKFKEDNRAIAINNTFARALPDLSPDFFHSSLPGQGFPFDNLQESAIWAGTPLYVFSVSKDKAWSLILTPDGYFAWVKSNDIAYVSTEFIHQWQTAAENGLIAVTQTETSILDERQQFQFTGYIGAVFPQVESNNQQRSILIPVKDRNNQAMIKMGILNRKASALMPLTASPKNLVKIINQLKNRPYGWGGAFFFNDCSQEMKSLFTPFGFWLPRNSAHQAQLGSTLDLSKNTLEERLKLLKENGHPLMTLIYIGGHIMLYIGNKETNNIKEAAITYQNIWGLSPSSRDKRYVIGQSLFFPLLKNYPENPDASSLASKPYFKLVFLDELGLKQESPQHFAKRFLGQAN
ncbi:MAG: SH3 domain-containing protein [Tatlockia sp.]|nr:SH3 domain-containing protein [Tatlockia sp.]